MSSNSTYCFDFLTERGCPLGQSCQLRHDIRRCSCDRVILLVDFEHHVASNQHKKQLVALGKSQLQGTVPPASASQVLPPNLKHGTSRKQRSLEVQAVFEEAARDKNGIVVSGKDGVDFGVVKEEEEFLLDVTITKVDIKSRICLSGFCMTSSTRKDEHGTAFSVSCLWKSRWINNNRPQSLVVTLHPSYAGRFQDTLELVFFDMRKKNRFLITRKVSAVVGSKDDHELLKPKSPYVKRKFIPLEFETPIIRSLRPPVWSPIKWKGWLPEFKPPVDLIRAAYRPDGEPASRRAISRFIPSQLNTSTYGKYFQAMLYIEEEQMRQDLDSYSMQDVQLEPSYPRYHLKVKGLSEGRPSVLVGDFILVRHQGVSDGPWYEGRVHKVYSSHVSLRFRDDFSTYRGSVFEVRFKLNRLSLRRTHQALTNSFNPSRLLFPGSERLQNLRRYSPAQLQSITLVNRLIGEDVEQLETVRAIIHQAPGSIPFVVFGPPGTGKTVTIVEAMRQLLIRDPNIHILACAPSNSAADLIAQRLVDLGPNQVLRLNSLTRRLDTLPKNLRRFSSINDNATFAIPSLNEMQKFRVVVSTCVSGGIPSGLGMKRGHFSHIFIDEAGQATEPQTMIPIKTMADVSTNVILAGDNKQLGPVVRSPLAAILGLKQSYLSRVMKESIYDPEMGKGVTIMKLVKNFRSHPAILEFPNSHFYNGDLQPCGNPALTHSLENSTVVVKKKFPLVFHAIIGRDEREESSPSFFNIDEASLVKNYCLSLITDRKNRIGTGDIGVITPYHAQRCKILNLFERDHRLDGITVGSVEEFQGQERRVIIMSTVRSNTNYVVSDIKRTLGFVANPERFNVAITRAQALLIVIGNPIVLSLDPLWRQFLNYIHQRGGWRGKNIEWNPEDPVDPGSNGYDGEMRNRVQGEAEETLERIRALISMKSIDDQQDLVSDLGPNSNNDIENPGFRREDE